MNILLILTGSALNRGMNTGLENLVWGLAEKGMGVFVLSGGEMPLKKKSYSYPDNVKYFFIGEALNSPFQFQNHYLNIIKNNNIDVVVGWIQNLAPIANIKTENRPIFVANEGRTCNRSIYITSLAWLVRGHINAQELIRYWSSIKKLNKIFTKVVGITKHVNQSVAKYYYFNPEKMVVINRGVDLDVFYPVEKTYCKDQVTLTFTGNVVPGKGVGDLVTALKLVNKSVNINLNLCGKVDKNYKEWIESELLNHNNVTLNFCGILPQKEVAEVLRKSDVFVLPSYSEGLSKSLIEAMACGCAVICSDIEPFKEVIENGVNGLIVPVGSPTSIARSFTTLAENRLLIQKYGNAAVQTIKERFSKETEVESWHRLLHKLVN